MDWFGTTTWPPFYCFGRPVWLPWRHVKMLYLQGSKTKLRDQEKCPWWDWKLLLPFVFFSFVFVVVVVVLFCLFVFSKSFHFFQECSLWSQRTLPPPSPSDFALLQAWGLLKVQTITAYRFVFLLFSIDFKKIHYTIFFFDKYLRNLSLHLKLSYIYLQNI